ncbi:hypothetical protein [Streptomyces sp. DH37]|uniref:hypothetical protein n=1 Tax=Streptomyces sp. DH37 TaxID=3040122 RepID=UPI002441DD5D|nr:hypothetical protein [Streptomyces sp. DH37]MDG9703823.1 hypothetical protein [Streptomyces sp. DH37]
MPSLASRLADAIANTARRAGQSTPAVRGADWQLATVTAVNTTGTVDCGAIRARRMESYGSPAVGDLIVITRSGSGNWVAWGRLRDSADTTTTGLVAGTDFGIVEWSGRRAGPHCYIRLAVTRTGETITAGSTGNINDLHLATIPAGWRPIESLVETIACDGFADGGAHIESSGIVRLRTWSPGGTIQSPRTIRLSASYLLL